MKFIALAAFCALAGGAAHANEAALCQADFGTFLTGTVTRGPVFARSRHPLHGVSLSHTHVIVLSDSDRRSFDIAIDNVFSPGYDSAGGGIPAPLSSIRAGDRLDVCGRPYMDETGPGLDWVHTNCGAPPTNRKPNGWLKKLGANGAPGSNLEFLRRILQALAKLTK